MYRESIEWLEQPERFVKGLHSPQLKKQPRRRIDSYVTVVYKLETVLYMYKIQ